MKKLMRTFALMAVAALGLSACTGEKLVPDNGNADGKFVTVHFGAEAAIEGATKATLTPNEGETAFQAAWEKGDGLSVYYINGKEVENDFQNGIVPATWNGKSFSAELPEYTGEWEYRAAYPVPDAVDNHVDFGPNRTQKGNAYNSLYDIMVGKATAAHAAAGKDDSDNDIVFQMDRQTAIAYFHFTSDLNEAVTSATLTVSGDGAAIASNYAYVSDFAWAAAEDCQSITITFPEAAPNAQDFQLWFNVLPTNYASMTLTVETATKTFTISKSTDGKYEAGKLYKVKKEKISWAGEGGSDTPSPVTDVIKASDLAATSTSYTDFSGVTITSEAVYAGNNAKNSNGAIQLRSDKSVSGIVSTTSGGKVTKVSVEWGSGTANGRIIDVYGNTNPYTSASELYSTTGNTNQGTKLGTIVKGTSTELVIDDNYPYIGIRSSSGALYLNSVSITWESGSSEPAPDTYTVSCATVSGGTLSASPVKAEAGAEVTLTATPDAGYEFNNDWTVKDADGAKIDVYDGKFTMPAQNVTVSGTFSKVAYTITKAAAENGSFIVKNGDAEVTTAFKGDKITLEATPAEGFTFGKWTVTYMDGETEKSFNPSANTFNMPAANVTVSATFVETAHVPVYASVAELVAAGKPTKDGTKVTVTLTDEEITKLYKVTAKDNKTYTNGVFLMVGNQEVEIYCNDTPANWEVGGTISGTLTNCDWKLFVNRNTQKETWELCPTDYSELTYKAPIPTCATPEINIDENGVASITCATEGATIHYISGDAPADPTEASDVFSSATLTDGQTIKAIAFAEGYKPSAVASKKYVAQGSLKTAILTADDIKGLGGIKYDAEKTILKEGLTWSFKAYKDSDSRPWVQLKKENGAYIKVIAPKPIKEIRLTITSTSNKSGGIEDITKHTDYSKDIHLKTTDSIGTSDTDDVAKTSVITNHLATLVPTGSNTELYIKVSAGARIWGIEVDY